MYKEYRELSRCAAVEACYQDMSARHRARAHAVQIIRVAEVANKDVRRPYVQQVLAKDLKFPLPHRVLRPAKGKGAVFAGVRPSTF